jgi:hypothetical protein
MKLTEQDDLFEFSRVLSAGPMTGVRGLFLETRLTEMRIEIPLKKAPAAYAQRHPCGFNVIPTRTADLPFTRRFE